MPNANFRGLSVWTGRTADENKLLRAELADIAAAFGYVTDQGPTKGQGSVGTLLIGMAEGEVAVLGPMDAYIHLSVLPWLNHQIEQEEKADREDETVLEFLVGLRSALVAASERRWEAQAARERQAKSARRQTCGC